jgi:hypothetical protein
MEETCSSETSLDFQRTTWHIFQKIEVFITTAVRTSNPAQYEMICHWQLVFSFMHVTVWYVLYITEPIAFRKSGLVQWFQETVRTYLQICRPVLSWTMAVEHEKCMKWDTDFNWLYIAYLLKLISTQYGSYWSNSSTSYRNSAAVRFEGTIVNDCAWRITKKWRWYFVAYFDGILWKD